MTLDASSSRGAFLFVIVSITKSVQIESGEETNAFVSVSIVD